MPIEAALVSSVLSSMASVGKILESTISLSKSAKSLTAIEFDEIQARAKLESNKEVAIVPGSRDQLARAMSQDMVIIINGEMQRISERLKKSLTDPRLSGAEKQKVINLEQEEYCRHLSMIKQFNSGRLPIDLDQEWENNRCDRF